MGTEFEQIWNAILDMSYDDLQRIEVLVKKLIDAKAAARQIKSLPIGGDPVPFDPSKMDTMDIVGVTMAEVSERLQELFSARGIGQELIWKLTSQAARHGIDPAMYLAAAEEWIHALPWPHPGGYSEWRLALFGKLQLFREAGVRPEKTRWAPPNSNKTKVEMKRILADPQCQKCYGSGWDMTSGAAVRCECKK